MSLKLECHTNLNVTQIRVSLKYECHSNWKTKYIEKVVNPKTSESASIGQISILLYVWLYSVCMAPVMVCFWYSYAKYPLNCQTKIPLKKPYNKNIKYFSWIYTLIYRDKTKIPAYS